MCPAGGIERASLVGGGPLLTSGLDGGFIGGDEVFFMRAPGR